MKSVAISKAPLPAVDAAGTDVHSGQCASPLNKGTILLVDDEPGVCQLCQTVLQGDGHDVLMANSAESAMRIWRDRSDNIDVLLTDYQLPETNGLTLAAWLHSQKPRLGVLLMSGSIAYGTPLPAYVSFLPKPFRLQTLTDAVRSLVQLARE